MDLVDLNRLRRAWYRLCGVEPDDGAVSGADYGEHEVAHEYLTIGIRAAQRWMIDNGYRGWVALSDPLVFEDAGTVTGVKRAPLPGDYMLADGMERKSALQLRDGRRWGKQVDGESAGPRGNVYWIPNLQHVFVGIGAQLPESLSIRYFRRHPAFPLDGSESIDFPVEARPLIVSEAAHAAMQDAWLPGGDPMKVGIAQRLDQDRERTRRVARTSRQQRKMNAPRRMGNRW